MSASSLLPTSQRRQAINTYKALAKLKPPPDQEYSVLAYFLAEKPENVYGFYIPLGNYPTKEQAINRVKHIIEITGHKSIFVMKTCTWQALDDQVRHDRTEYIPVDMNGKLLQQYQKDIAAENERLEERKRIEEELLSERENEQDPTTIDSYIHNWYVAIKNRATYSYYSSEALKAKENFDKRVSAIRDQYARQPDFDEKWLPLLKERLTRRNEGHIYEMIVKAVHEIHDEVLPPFEQPESSAPNTSLPSEEQVSSSNSSENTSSDPPTKDLPVPETTNPPPPPPPLTKSQRKKLRRKKRVTINPVPQVAENSAQ
jgi:hypothetical protein